MFRVEAIGNIGADAVRKEDGGRVFYIFKVAHSERWKDAKGNEHERTTWISCIMNEKMGDAVASYLVKGKKVYVRGRATLEIYSSQIERCMKAGISISVDELDMLGGSADEVPRRLVDPTTAQLHDVYKAYYVNVKEWENEKIPAELVSERGKRFTTDANGFLFPVKETDDGTAES